MIGRMKEISISEQNLEELRDIGYDEKLTSFDSVIETLVLLYVDTRR